MILQPKVPYETYHVKVNGLVNKEVDFTLDFLKDPANFEQVEESLPCYSTFLKSTVTASAKAHLFALSTAPSSTT